MLFFFFFMLKNISKVSENKWIINYGDKKDMPLPNIYSFKHHKNSQSAK